ncbi:hypothetical protein IEO21_02594 [Rhodonia placenta]|uniref:N-acetyltransferase domain-containing protein n=1 Tax=Rhodonia placenta TaxID=104341 RepID=A0A8H7U4Q7_9APHY|nr:hypothetical protein IEO21_02594 [Postia placenta]
MTDPELHLVHYETVQEFLHEMKPFDESFMNLALGPLWDDISTNPTRSEERSELSNRPLFAVLSANVLVMTLTRDTAHQTWKLAIPSTLNPDSVHYQFTIAGASRLLASTLDALVEPGGIERIAAPSPVMDVFIDAWATSLSGKGIQITALPLDLIARSCYATRQTVPSSSACSLPANITIALAAAEDVSSLVPLFVDFTYQTHQVAMPEAARASLSRAVQGHKLWVCRFDGDLAGFTVVGRETPNTIAIRNVFVRPEHRRKGIAERMVGVLTRFYLGLDTVLEPHYPMGQPKREICLLVKDPAVERIYARCGFLVGEDVRDPETGRKACYAFVSRGVQTSRQGEKRIRTTAISSVSALDFKWFNSNRLIGDHATLLNQNET